MTKQTSEIVCCGIWFRLVITTGEARASPGVICVILLLHKVSIPLHIIGTSSCLM